MELWTNSAYSLSKTPSHIVLDTYENILGPVKAQSGSYIDSKNQNYHDL